MHAEENYKFYFFFRYFDNAKTISYSYKHRPQTALETAVWWVEYIANTEGTPLVKSSSIYMSRFVYYSLDVYLVIALVLFLSSASWYWIFKTFISKNNKQNKIKTK